MTALRGRCVQPSGKAEASWGGARLTSPCVESERNVTVLVSAPAIQLFSIRFVVTASCIYVCDCVCGPGRLSSA